MEKEDKMAGIMELFADSRRSSLHRLYVKTIARYHEIEYLNHFPNDKLLISGYIRAYGGGIPTDIHQIFLRFYHIPLPQLKPRMSDPEYFKSPTRRRIIKEYLDMKRDPSAYFEVSPITDASSLKWKDNLFDWDGACLPWKAIISGPPNTPYEGGEFVINIEIVKEYPFRPPKFKLMTKVFHCNMDQDRICLDILHSSWAPALMIRKLLLSVYLLLETPNADDSLEEYIAELYKTNRSEYDKICREWTAKYAKTDAKK